MAASQVQQSRKRSARRIWIPRRMEVRMRSLLLLLLLLLLLGDILGAGGKGGERGKEGEGDVGGWRGSDVVGCGGEEEEKGERKNEKGSRESLVPWPGNRGTGVSKALLLLLAAAPPMLKTCHKPHFREEGEGGDCIGLKSV